MSSRRRSRFSTRRCAPSRSSTRKKPTIRSRRRFARRRPKHRKRRASSARLRALMGSSSREALGEAYLDATSHAYGAGAASDGIAAASAFRARVAKADAFVHVQDMEGQDVLDSDAFAEHEGGFSAAAAALGAKPALYHADT